MPVNNTYGRDVNCIIDQSSIWRVRIAFSTRFGGARCLSPQTNRSPWLSAYCCLILLADWGGSKDTQSIPCLPGAHRSLLQCWFNAVPASATPAQHWTCTAATSRVDLLSNVRDPGAFTVLINDQSGRLIHPSGPLCGVGTHTFVFHSIAHMTEQWWNSRIMFLLSVLHQDEIHRASCFLMLFGLIPKQIICRPYSYVKNRFYFYHCNFHSFLKIADWVIIIIIIQDEYNFNTRSKWIKDK